MLAVKAEEEEEANKKKKSKEGTDGVVEHVDDHIGFSHLTKSSHLSTTDDMFDLAMTKAVSGVKKETMDLSTSKLSKVRFHNFLLLMDQIWGFIEIIQAFYPDRDV